MLLRNGRDDEGRVEIDEGLSKRSELRVSSPDFDILCPIRIPSLGRKSTTYPGPYSIHDEAPTALMVLPGVCDEDR